MNHQNVKEEAIPSKKSIGNYKFALGVLCLIVKRSLIQGPGFYFSLSWEAPHSLRITGISVAYFASTLYCSLYLVVLKIFGDNSDKRVRSLFYDCTWLCSVRDCCAENLHMALLSTKMLKRHIRLYGSSGLIRQNKGTLLRNRVLICYESFRKI